MTASEIGSCENLNCIHRNQTKYFPYYHLFVWTLNITLWIAAYFDGAAGTHDRFTLHSIIHSIMIRVGMTPDGSCWVNGNWVWAGFGQYITTGLTIITLIFYVIYKARNTPQVMYRPREHE